MPVRRPEDLTILVVEDYEDTSLAMRLALEDQGYRILEAADGARAIEVAASERPDVILMDLGLPDMDGLAAAEQIRADPALRDTVIVAVTARGERAYRARALAAGCNAFVTKPFDFDWLRDLLDNLLA